MNPETPNQPAIEPTPNKPTSSLGQDWLRFIAETVRTIVIVLVLAYALRIFVVQPFVVEGASMYPRFNTNDYLIVDKLSYRFSTPQRGDIIVFVYPYSQDTNYVKRIIGLPGEKVIIENGKVKIINNSYPEGVILDESAYLNGVSTSLSPTSTKNEFIVPSNQYFVLGDNRPASSDSRTWGFLDKSKIIGRVVVQAYPIDHLSWVQHARY